MKDSSNQKNKKSGIGFVIGIIIVLTLFISFLVLKDTILTVLKETEFCTIVFGKEPSVVENYIIPERQQENNKSLTLTPQEQLAESLGLEDTIIPAVPKETDIITPSIEEIETEVEEKESETEQPVVEAPKKEETVVALPPVEVVKTDQHLYFIYVNADGSVTRKESVRSVQKTITPLSAALKSLLNGPNPEERDNGYVSFIPANTQLLSVSIHDKTAMINFSEEFTFNQYGLEGYLAQLMQVIYTATTFNTIKDVQILIEGEQTSYLGTDGVWIGSPLARTDFN